jgi:hypothetical protein
MYDNFMSDGELSDVERRSLEAGKNLMLGLMQGVQMRYGDA